MKKKLLVTLMAICLTFAVASLSACFGPGITYTLDSSSFNATVAYQSQIDISGLTLKGSDGSTVKLTSDMVSGLDTNSVGAKTLTVSYDGETYTVNYTVKYLVEFKVDGSTVSTQYVLNASEIALPEGTTASDWTPSVSDQLTGNAVFNKVAEAVDVTVNFAEDSALVLDLGAGTQTLVVNTTGASDWTVAFDNGLSVRKIGNNALAVTSVKAGVSTITVTANGAGGSATASKKVIVKPAQLLISESGEGIEGIRTYGRTNANGAVSEFELSVDAGNADSVASDFANYIEWQTSNALATVENGVLTLGAGIGAEMVEFVAKFVVDGVEYLSSAPFTARCVWDGVNVSTYEELWTATNNNKVVVLNANIEFPKTASAIHYTEMHTTYDDTFYANLGKQADAKIKTLIQFKNDVYGNGHIINAHNATLGLLDSTGGLTNESIFRGPLNFVALTSSGVSAVSVKGQDNVCFAVFAGVTVNNVELRGADFSTTGDNVDLTELDYAGTVVEVFGDDVTIEYSRINNGRTVLRAFGDVNDATKVINLNVTNCVLSGAREFIVRIGSNCFVDGTTGNVSPYINGSRDLISDKKNYSSKTASEKSAYDSEYIKTFVTLKNSVLKDAGIFAIGIDSHFAGTALHDGTQYGNVLGEAKELWKNLAKTSYGAKITLEGEVKLYNWKPLDQIDSSTLIEITEPDGLQDGWATKLQFDVCEMVGLAAQKPGFETIVAKYQGTDYVHAGIAYFGGGKNYGIFEDKTTAGMNLQGFQVSLESVGKSFLTAAAGKEDFYFNIYDASLTGFTPDAQAQLLAGANAYDCIYKK